MRVSKHIRTIAQTIDEIKKNDPETAITAYYLRQLVKNGAIPHRQAGNKILVVLEDVADFFAQGGENHD